MNDYEISYSTDDDNSYPSSDDGDDENNGNGLGLGFTTKKRKKRGGWGYTTFGDEDAHVHHVKKSSEQTKEDNLYGVFAKKLKKDNIKWEKGVNRDTAVAFVKESSSTTTTRATETDGGEKKQNETQPNQDFQYEDTAPDFHMKETEQEVKDSSHPLNSFSSSSPAIPSSHNIKSETPSLSDFLPSTASAAMGIAPQPPKRNKIDPNLGKWEKHTKGIGMKLLQKMGFTGSGGLGKRNNNRAASKQQRSSSSSSSNIQEKSSAAGVGISKPIEVVVRPANLGLGYGNFKEAHTLKNNKQIETELHGKKDGEIKAKNKDRENSPLSQIDQLLQRQQFKKNNNNTKKKESTIYKVIPYQNIIQSNNEKNEMKIIDMRGPITSVSTASQIAANKPVPLGEELLHNTTLLINSYEQRLRSNQYLLNSSLQKKKSINTQISVLETNFSKNEVRGQYLQRMQSLIEQVDFTVGEFCKNNKPTDNKFSMKEIKSFIANLNASLLDLKSHVKNSSSSVEDSFHLYSVVIPSIVKPAVHKTVSQLWNPFRNPEFVVELLQDWKTLFLPDPPTTTAKEEEENEGDDEFFERNKKIEAEAIFTLFKAVIDRIRHLLLAEGVDSWNITDRESNESCVSLYNVLSGACETFYGSHNEIYLDNGIHHSVISSLNRDNVPMMVNDLLSSVIFPKAKEAIKSWKPSAGCFQFLKQRYDKSVMKSIDNKEYYPWEWITPWFSKFNEILKAQLVNEIQQKLKKLLVSLCSSPKNNLRQKEESLCIAFNLLLSWKSILSSSRIHTIISNHVSPLFAKALNTICSIQSMTDSSTSEDEQQRIKMNILLLLFLFEDHGLFPKHMLLSLIEGEFCLYWSHSLYMCLFSSSSSTQKELKEKVHSFYSTWKSLLFKDNIIVQNDEVIVRYFYAGLHMMMSHYQQQVQEKSETDDIMSAEEPPFPSSLNYRSVLRRRQKEERNTINIKEKINESTFEANQKHYHESKQTYFTRPSPNDDGSLNVSFKKVVEEYASQNGIVLYPRMEGVDANARMDGKQVYDFGKIPIFLEENVVFVLSKGKSKEVKKWEPTSLDELVSLAHKKGTQ